MSLAKHFRKLTPLLAAASLLLAAPSFAEDPPADTGPTLRLSSALIERATDSANAAVSSVAEGADAVVARALELVGIRYRRGGSSPKTGFDCSGFVDNVFKVGLGLILPHNASQIARTGERVKEDDLQPGDLVFFNTMRRAFSHVGIYLGDHLFVHAPHTGAEVRVEDMRERYWVKRFDGARRMIIE
ncbi:MAG TPA: C40 family peptidase [Rhodocyclaceae bacterium]|nr:C40 family peptidase [Rhodocyclaceae bacterium]